MIQPSYQPSLIRRLLPWLYILLFFVLAPLIISYTAGYRYNTKKGSIERNGTLIISSIPRGAKIFLDGKDTKETTPVTLQNITPGMHDLALEKSGYHVWKKSLEIRSEQVTFANQVALWRDEVPTLVLQQDIRRLKADPLEESLALGAIEASSTVIHLWNRNGLLDTTTAIPATDPTHLQMSFRDDSLALLWQEKNAPDRQGWISWDNALPKTASLPAAFYRWSGTELLGVQSTSLLHLQTHSSVTTRESLPLKTVDVENGYTLETTDLPGQLALLSAAWWKRKWLLPIGAWHIATIQKPFVLLRDGSRFLAVKTQSDTDAYGQEIRADEPRWLLKAKSPTALFLTPNEILLWTLGDQPTPLWRQSDPLIQTQWSTDGASIFIATQKSLFSLELDERNGRQVTELTSFDDIRDFARLDKTLYIAGTKDGKSGLWKLEVE